MSSFPTNGGDGELRTSVYPSNFAPIAAKLRQRAFQTICKFRFFDAEKKKSEKNSDLFFGFSLFSVDFRGARVFLTSESSSSRFFALDGQIFRSVRPLELIFRFFTVRTSSCGGKARVTEIPGGRSPPDPPLGGKAQVTEIPEGGSAPPPRPPGGKARGTGIPGPRPPHHNISKNLPSGQIYI